MIVALQARTMPMRADHPLPELSELAPSSALCNPTATRVRRAFARALGLAFASSLGACADASAARDPLDGAPSSRDLGRLSCEGFDPLPLDAIEPAQPVDFVAVRQVSPAGQGAVFERARAGTPCATATDVAACEEALAATALGLPPAESCGVIACQQFVVTTRGDEVKRYTSRTELVQFLGAIDTPAEALVLLDRDQFAVNCGEHSRIVEREDGFLVSSTTRVQFCPRQDAAVTKLVRVDGRVEHVGSEPIPAADQMCAVPGRRPEGLCGHQRQAPAATELGAYFAGMAHFEAASIAAFEVLALELAQHGAPEELVVRARLAARDELRHAALTAAQAYRFGASPVIPQVEPRAVRSLEEIALDNATEGAVRETFSALLACHQARAARDPVIADMMRQIAEDEIAHATLSLDIQAWIEPRLEERARERIRAAQALAVASLVRGCGQEPGELERAIAGVPGAEVARRMCKSLAEGLWA